MCKFKVYVPNCSSCSRYELANEGLRAGWFAATWAQILSAGPPAQLRDSWKRQLPGEVLVRAGMLPERLLCPLTFSPQNSPVRWAPWLSTFYLQGDSRPGRLINMPMVTS